MLLCQHLGWDLWGNVPAFDLSTLMTSVVTSAVVLGQLFGALFAGRISNTIGRKRSLVLVALG